LAKRAGPGRGGKDRARRSGPSPTRARRKGKYARHDAKHIAKHDGAKEPVRRASSSAIRTPPKSGREAIVREIRATGIDGQLLVAQERDGERWQIECLGEPLEVGARILFLPLSPESARQGELIRLVEAPRTQWVCTLQRSATGLRLTPFGGLDQATLSLTEKNSKGAADGTRVVVIPADSTGKRGRASSGPSAADSESRPNRGRRASSPLSVRVVEILGMPLDPNSDHRALVWKHRLTTQFSRRARLESEEIPGTLTEHELARRVDLRHLPFVTIDPASARDHDDAVFAEKRSMTAVAIVDGTGRAQPRPAGGTTWTHRLWVAIADVSHFVVEGGWIDADARRRGNSFYFPDRAIPMLPERLSSDLCSLRADVDRLAMVVELRMTADGQVADALFHEAVVRSRAGLSYDQANEWLSSNLAEAASQRPEWGDSLECLSDLATALTEARQRAGAIALDLPEIEIQFDEGGHAVDARVRKRNRTHLMIEEAMLAANRAVARALDLADRETIHRVHPPPSGQKLAALAELLDQLGIEVQGELHEPGVLAKVLQDVKGMPTEERIHVAALRSLSQARYDVKSLGHYALRFEHYVHFTSPIRRYADLDVHRGLKKFLNGEAPPTSDQGENSEDSNGAARRAIWLSGRERVAAEVERDAEAMACCAIMQGREGERFAARVTGAAEFGLFVRLETPAVSGLVPMRELDGYWTHDAAQDALVGSRSGMRISLGDPVSVRLLEVDPNRGRLAFRLAKNSIEPGHRG
jgi:ribonuclease R